MSAPLQPISLRKPVQAVASESALHKYGRGVPLPRLDQRLPRWFARRCRPQIDWFDEGLDQTIPGQGLASLSWRP